MKSLITIVAISAIFFATGCGRSNIAKSPRRQKTPSHLVMSQSEKNDVNYDKRENQKTIETNLKNKQANMKAAEKNRKKQNEQLNELNKNSSKVKRRNRSNEAFTFY
jgi:flagellar motility protein MotE (MotC chaperone)